MTLNNTIYKSLDSWGDHPVFILPSSGGQHETISAGQFRSRISEMTVAFRNMGIGRNVAVPMFLDNSWNMPAAFLAIRELEGIPVLVKKAWRRLELQSVFDSLDPSVILCDREGLSILEEYLAGRTVLVLNDDGSIHSEGRSGIRETEVPEGTVSINYTYRGHGYPLGAMVGSKAYIDAANRYQSYVQFKSPGKVLVLLPMNHIFTLVSSVFLPLLNGLSICILNSLNPKTILETIKSENIRYLSSIPEILQMLARVKTDAHDTGSLEVLISGGSYLSPENHELIVDTFGVEVLIGYGLTEIAPVTANLRSHGKKGTLGEFCRGLSGRIEKSADKDNGEISVQASEVFFGYYRQPEETSEVFDGDWFLTGDTGYEDDGYICFTGEKKRTRKVNGQLVDLTEIERALRQVDGIRKASVRGETNSIHARIVLMDDEADEKEETRRIRKELGDLIASYKIPRTFSFTRE